MHLLYIIYTHKYKNVIYTIHAPSLYYTHKYKMLHTINAPSIYNIHTNVKIIKIP